MARPSCLALAAILAAACAAPVEPVVPPPTVAQPPLGAVFSPAAAATGGVTSPLPLIDREALRAFAKTRSFRLGAPQQMHPTPDGKAVLFLRSGPRDPKQSLFELDMTSGATRELLTPDALLRGPEDLSPAERARRERMRITSRGFATYEISRDGKRVLLPLSGKLFVLDRVTGKTRELATGEGVIDPHFSPDGARVAYVRGADVYSIGADGGAEVAVTRGGTEKVTHGVAEFVAQEELGRSRGFWFSPDSTRIAYEEADVSRVEVLRIGDPAHPEREPERSAYPRAGTANAEVRLGIVSSLGSGTTWVAWDRAKYPYLVSVRWEEGGPLTIYVMDRLQKNAALLAVDDKTGSVVALLTEHDDAWLNHFPDAPRWVPASNGKPTSFLWATERSGALQLELRDDKGTLVRELTSPTFGYRGLEAVDTKRRTAIFEASDEPTEEHVFEVALDAGEPHLVRGDRDEEVSAHGSDGSVVVTVERSRTAMPRYFARSPAGVREIPAVREGPSFLPQVELVQAGADKTRVAIVRPRRFVAGARYPVIDAAYGGPHVNVVVADVAQFLRAQWMADATGAIVVSIDARGTPHRGRAWERALADHVADVPLEGHIAAIRALGETHPEMDTARVGVYGWSYGGYFSALAVLARPDFYKVAFAGAPVVDWRDYDTCYTERYLGLPSANVAAYDAGSLLTYAAKPAPSRPLFLVHGTADDNVYFLNSLKLTNALERARKPFEFSPLSNVTHLLVEPELLEAVYARGADFLREGLGSRDAAR